MEKQFFISRSVICVLLTIFIMIMGVLLHRAGKPYNTVYFTMHKIASVGLIVLFIIFAAKYLKLFHTGLVLYMFVIFTGLFLLMLLISGGFLSLYKFPEPMLKMHRVFSFILFAGIISGSVYVLFQKI